MRRSCDVRANQDTYPVTATPITTYVTLDALKVTLDISQTTWDNDLNQSIEAASRAIDGCCNRRFYLDADDTSVRYYTPLKPMYLDIDDVTVLESVMTDTTGDGTFDATWTLNSDYDLAPYNAMADVEQWPYTCIEVRPYGSFTFQGIPRSVQVTGQFGWPAVPAGIIEGTTKLAERMFKVKREAPLGVLAFQDMAIRVAKTDPNVYEPIARYLKKAVVVA